MLNLLNRLSSKRRADTFRPHIADRYATCTCAIECYLPEQKQQVSSWMPWRNFRFVARLRILQTVTRLKSSVMCNSYEAAKKKNE